MCDCIIMGRFKIIDGLVFVDNIEVKDIPSDLRKKLFSGKVKYKEMKNRIFVDKYEFINGEFKKTVRALLVYYRKGNNHG